MESKVKRKYHWVTGKLTGKRNERSLFFNHNRHPAADQPMGDKEWSHSLSKT
jgi:hypothetical protein